MRGARDLFERLGRETGEKLVDELWSLAYLNGSYYC